MANDVMTASPANLLVRLRVAFTPAELGVALSVLAPGDAYLLAARLGIEVAIDRDDQALLENYVGGRWHRQHPLPSRSDVERRRYPPRGDREEWIRIGPPGHQDYLGQRGGTAA